MSDVYESAIREWIARQIRARGHTDVDRDCIRNVQFKIGTGFHGSDVTPPDEPFTAVVCELTRRQPGGRIGSYWHEHEETLEFITPAELVAQCLAIVSETS